MVALGMYRATRCPGCRGDLTETTAPENEDRYVGDLPVQCFRCLAFSRVHERYREAPYSHTLLHQVRLRPKRG